jgi:hypothetical protein
MAYKDISFLIRVVAGVAAAWLCKQFAVWLYRFYSTQRWLKTTSIPGPPLSNKLIGKAFQNNLLVMQRQIATA